MNFNSGKGAPVATNRILSLLSPFVITSASEGGSGVARNHVDVSEATRKTERGWRVQLELMDVCPSLSKQRQTAKPQHLTTKSARHENEGCHLRSRISDNGSTREQAGQETPMVAVHSSTALHDENAATIARQTTTFDLETRCWTIPCANHEEEDAKALKQMAISQTNLRDLAPKLCPTFAAVKCLP